MYDTVNAQTQWAIGSATLLVSYWLDAFFADFSSSLGQRASGDAARNAPNQSPLLFGHFSKRPHFSECLLTRTSILFGLFPKGLQHPLGAG
jgi:hypothetical protein